MSRSRSDLPSRVVAITSGSTAWANMSSSHLITSIPGHLPIKSAAWTEMQSSSQEPQTLWVISRSVMPLWLQPIPVGVHSLAELASVARAHVQDRMGDSQRGMDWTVQGDWRSDRPFVCQALPGDLLRAMGKAPNVSSPYSIGAASLDSCGIRDGWCAITTPFEAHLVYLHCGKSLHIRGWQMDGPASPVLIEQHLADEWRREKLRTDWQDDTLHWLHLGPTQKGSPGQRGLRWANEDLQQALNLGMPSPEKDLSPYEASSHLCAAVCWLKYMTHS